MPAESKKQQRFFGMVHAVQKGDLSPSEVGPAIRKAARNTEYSDAKDFASTKHKNLPEKKGSLQMKYFEKNPIKYFEKDAGLFEKILKRTKKPVTGSVVMPTGGPSGARIAGKGPAIGSTKAHGTTKAKGSGYKKRKTTTKRRSAVQPVVQPTDKKDITGLVGAGALGLGTGIVGTTLLD